MGFLSLLQTGREILLPANMQPGSVAEAGGRNAGILDQDALSRIAAHGSDGPAEWRTDADPDRAVLRFYTSGSTGSPKIVTKRLTQIENELANLHTLWGHELQGRRVHSSVSHQHIYGFLFSAMLPLCMGLSICAERIGSPQSLEQLQGEASVLVLSPAFLKRAVQTRAAPYSFSIAPIIFSSGGVLPRATAQVAERIFGTRPREIFGSTETGGIAHRTSGGDEPWKCFPGVRVRISGDSRIEVQSPYLSDGEYFSTEDAGRLLSPGTFSLLGRIDSIVKIEDERVALGEVESRIRESPLVEEAHVVALETSRQFLAAVVVLSSAGKLRFGSASRREITAYFRAHLLNWFARTVLPRKWRYVESIPRDLQGKVLRKGVLDLFEQPEAPVLSREPRVEIVERDGSSLAVSLSFPANSIFFDGHFPSFKILPAVVQVDWVMRFARQQLDVIENLEEILRLKFLRPILPGMPLRLEIQFDAKKDQIQFRYLLRESGELLSSGKMKLKSRE
jgi:acyl-coenzyme A synthetase/AMP-(fatty) acid ligase/3-hydroxymyristoyl/3-hydroxydecanoyl-(acyl carrier protein) dehydratase